MMNFINPAVQATVATLCIVADLMCQNISSASILDSGKDFRYVIAFSIRFAATTVIGILDDFRLMLVSIFTKIGRGTRFVVLSILSIALSFKDLVLGEKAGSPLQRMKTLQKLDTQDSAFPAYSYKAALKARLAKAESPRQIRTGGLAKLKLF